MNNTIPKSQELFNDLYIKLSNKLEESEGTLFSGVSIREHQDTNYKRFLESTYASQFFIDESTYQKNETIKCFIENEVLSIIMTDTIDSLVDLNNGTLSFAQQIITESTCEQFNLKYRGELLEEGFGLGLASITAAISAITGWIPSLGLAAFGALSVLGVSLLLPSRYARSWDDGVEKYLGTLVASLLGTQTLISMENTSVGASIENIINFDNIDTNPEIRKLFRTLARTTDKKAPIQGINTIIATCVDQNEILNSTEDSNENSSLGGFLRGVYSPRNHNVFTLFINSMFKSASSKKDEEYGTLLRYRRCLSEKMVDLYKFLMIANVMQSQDYKKIIRVMERGFHDNPEQLLSFMTTDSDEDQLNKENIKTLIQFRMYLEKMALDLKKGTFDVDKEASIFLTQKLKNVDREVSDYLSKNGRQIETAFENKKEFDEKRYKHNRPDEKSYKRKSFGFGTKFKD